MHPNRIDHLSELFKQRRLSRRAVLAGGAGVGAAAPIAIFSTHDAITFERPITGAWHPEHG